MRDDTTQRLNLSDIRQLVYQGGGYFRMPGPVGVKRQIVHAPDLLRRLLDEIDRRAPVDQFFCGACQDDENGYAGCCANCGRRF